MNLRNSLQRSFFQDCLRQHSGDMKKTWQVIKRFWPYLNKKSPTACQKHDSDKAEIAETFNSFFATVGETLADKIPDSAESPLDFAARAPTFDIELFTLETIVEYMQNLSPSTSCGVDGITARLLKAAGPTIFPVILHICNISIESNTFPDCWKTACITPLHKEGNTIDPTNFRPISVLPCLGKLLERLVHNQVYGYLTANGILSPNQAGFRKGYSMGTCLIEFLHHIYSNIDAGRVSGVLFLDFSKAFDTVEHDIMISKLRHLGFKASSTSWFRSYLTDRQQVTKIDDELSGPAAISHGVPQGSILGPVMFSLYVNDLPEALRDCHISLYVDNTAVAASFILVPEK